MPRFWDRTPSDVLPEVPHYDVKAHLTYVRELWRKYPYRDAQACAENAADLVVNAGYTSPIGEEMAWLVAKLLEDNEIFINKEPTLEHAPYLTRIQKRLTLRHDQAFIAVREFLRNLLKLLPTERGIATIPLHTLFKPQYFIGFVYRCFHDVTNSGEYLFADLRHQLYRNLITASGHDPETYDGRRKLVLPEESRETPEEVYRKYFNNTPFLNILDLPVPFSIPERARFEHHHICAKSGHGKTTLYSVMLERDLERVARGEASIILIDSQGDFLEREVLRYKEFAPGGSLHDRMIYVDPTDLDHPIQLNIFARTGNTAPPSTIEKHHQRNAIFELFHFVFGAMGQKLTGRQETLFRAVSALALEIPDANLTTLNQLFTPSQRKEDNPLAPFQRYIDRLDDAERQFFATDFHSHEFSDTRNQIRARVQSLLMNPVFRAMFNATEQALDLTAEMDRGTVTLINCNKDFLKQGTEIFGRFFIALIKQATQARANTPQRERTPCFVYIDECQQYIADDANITEMLETARKYRVGMLLAHQYLGQIKPPVQAALQGAAIKMVGQPNENDQRTLASQLRTTTEFLHAQPIGTFATFVNGVTPNAVALKIPFAGLRDKPKMTESELQRVLARNREKYCTPAPTREAPVAAEASNPIQEQDSNTPTIPPQQPTSDIEFVITAARRIETLLETHCAASGRGLHEKLDSVQTKIPAYLLNHGRYVATIRNKVVHVDAFTLPDRSAFVRCARAFDEYFSPKPSDLGEIPSDPTKRW